MVLGNFILPHWKSLWIPFFQVSNFILQSTYENEDVLVSRLFYVIPDIFEVKLRVFIFYEENTFLKTKGDDLKLIHSELKIQ